MVCGRDLALALVYLSLVKRCCCTAADRRRVQSPGRPIPAMRVVTRQLRRPRSSREHKPRDLSAKSGFRTRPRRSNLLVGCQKGPCASPRANLNAERAHEEISRGSMAQRMAFFTGLTGHHHPQTTKAARSSPLRGPGCPLPGNTVCHAVPLVPLGNPKTMTSKQRESKKRARRKENQKPKPAKPPTKAQQKTKRRLQSLRRRAERQDRTPKLTRRDEHSSLAKSLGVRSLDLFRSFCPHESF